MLPAEPPVASANSAPTRNLQSRESGSSAVEAITSALGTSHLVKGCSTRFLEWLAHQARPLRLAADETLSLSDTGKLLVLEEGALRLQVGGGLTTAVGPGTVLNATGFLELSNQAEDFRPRRASFRSQVIARDSGRTKGFDVQDYNGPPPALYQDRRGAPELPDDDDSDKNILTENHLCFYNVCPYAASIITKKSYSDWMDLSASGAEETTFAAIPPLKQLLDPLKSALDLSMHSINEREVGVGLQQLEKNCEELTARWSTLMHSCNTILPGAPVEVAWDLVEASEVISIEMGRVIVKEGQISGTVQIIEQGVATVEKAIGSQQGPLGHQVIGRLLQGAIIGDLGFLGSVVPCAATVRAKTDVKIVRLSHQALIGVLSRFPGALLGGAGDRLDIIAECLQERLTAKAEVVGTLNLFQGFSTNFIDSMALSGQRQIFHCGHTVVEEGSTHGTLFVLEHGTGTVEISGKGKVADVPTGNCFGERTLMGISPTANATVRVSSTFAMFLVIPRSVLERTIERHPDEKAHIKKLRETSIEGRVVGSKIRHIKLFMQCSDTFKEFLNQSLQTICFTPGQTIVLEGAEERNPQMFVLNGGLVCTERRGQRVATMSPGATFGELAMLGISERRAATVRAITFCFASGICRSAFFSALKEFPEEEQHFQQVFKDIRKGTGVTWPCFENSSTRFLYLLDLYVEQRRFLAGDESLGRPPESDAAILILGGNAMLVGEDGNIETLGPGCCFNAQVLVDAPPNRTKRLVPSTNCDVLILTSHTWGKILAEFPDETDRIKKTILRYIAEQAEKSLGCKPKSAGALCLASAFFKASSTEFAERIRSHLDSLLFLPGTLIAWDAPESEEASVPTMYLVLAGTACREDAFSKIPITAGTMFGETKLLGIMKTHNAVLRAETLCTVQTLRKRDFDDTLSGFVHDKELVSTLHEEAHNTSPTGIRKKLQWSAPFRAMRPEFVGALIQGVEVVLYAPGTAILTLGEPCVLGESPFFLVLAGRVNLEGQYGATYGVVQAGQVFGEVGAVGLTETRTCTAWSWDDRLVCCARFHGAVIAAAFNQFPAAREPMAELLSRLEKNNTKLEQQRCQWIRDVAVPALAQTPLLAGCPYDFLNAVAVELVEKKYPAGAIITSVGEPTESMLIMLQGSADVLGKSGEKLGELIQGSAFGEVAALGLFASRMATIHAQTYCRVLAVPETSLRNAIANAGGESMSECFRVLISSRHEQVEHGLPICAMNIGAHADDVGVRVIALLSECIHLEPGDVWSPISDGDPCGPCFGVLVRGRASVVMNADHNTVVMPFLPGSIFPEGLAASQRACVRADTICEAYRVRRSEFMLAVKSDPTSGDWIWRFKLKEKSTMEQFRMRLGNVKGLLEGGAPHARDEEIQAWKAHKRHCASRARQLRREKSDPSVAKLPPVHQLSSATASGRFFSGGVRQSSSPRQTPTAAARAQMEGPAVQGRGQNANSKLQLPRLAAGTKALSGARSEPLLRGGARPNLESPVLGH